ncbi:MAG: hypothetical protein KAH77_01650 [Thiomargarita sp.]|nr:hypothetical protein [Thiomargarita sp.]
MNLKEIEVALKTWEHRISYNVQHAMTRSEQNILSALEQQSGILQIEKELHIAHKKYDVLVKKFQLMRKERDDLQAQLKHINANKKN